jgi:hypothetical protein
MIETSDAWFMAFLLYKQFKIEKFEADYKGKVKGTFNIPKETWNSLKLEFSQSEFVKFKTYIDLIKDLGR